MKSVCKVWNFWFLKEIKIQIFIEFAVKRATGQKVTKRVKFAKTQFNAKSRMVFQLQDNLGNYRQPSLLIFMCNLNLSQLGQKWRERKQFNSPLPWNPDYQYRYTWEFGRFNDLSVFIIGFQLYQFDIQDYKTINIGIG